MATWDKINQNLPSDEVALKAASQAAYKPQTSPYLGATYSESPAVAQAKKNLESQLNNGTTKYQSAYNDKILSLLDKVSSNNVPNLNVQPIRQEFVKNIDRAAEDTLLNMAKLSGGYGNTYSGAVADQQKQSALPNINNINPALMQLAYSASQSEKNDAYKLLDVFSTQDQIAYGRHRDTVADKQSEVQRLTDMYLSQLQSDRANFEGDRAFNQSAFEFEQAQKQSAFEDYQNRKQSQIQEDNSNNISAWGDAWDNYYDIQNINEANKQNAFDEQYNNYQLAERAKSIAEAQAKAAEAARKAKEKADKETEEDEAEDYVYNPNATSLGIYNFKNTHGLHKDEFEKRANNNPTVGYNGYTNYEDYIDAELESFRYEDESGKKKKLTDDEKKHLITYYDMYYSL